MSSRPEERYNEAMRIHRTKLRYQGGGYNLYKPKDIPKNAPQWPGDLLAKRPDKGSVSRITKAFVHSPKRKVVLRNPYDRTTASKIQAPNHIFSTQARLKNSNQLSPRRRKFVRNSKAQDSDLLNVSTKTATRCQPNRATDELCKRLHEEIKGCAAINQVFLENSYLSDEKKKNFSVEPRTMYLLSNYLAFDKFDQHERTEIMNELLGKWLVEEYDHINYGSTMLWDSVRSYCESTYMLDRITSRRKTPNALSAAACCEILDIISRKEQRYGRILRVIKEGIYDSIYVDRKEKNIPFFHRKAWFTQVKVAENVLRKTRQKMKEAEVRCSCNKKTEAQTNYDIYANESLKSIVHRSLPLELAREINSMGEEYVLSLINDLTKLQRQNPLNKINKINKYDKHNENDENDLYNDSVNSEESNNFLLVRNWN